MESEGWAGWEKKTCVRSQEAASPRIPQSTSFYSGSRISHRHGHRVRALQSLKVADKVALAASLGALREPTILLHGLPLFGDEAERLRAILDGARLDEPAADDEARAADAPAAVDRGDAAAVGVVLEDVEDLTHVAYGAGKAAVRDGERVVLDVCEVDAEVCDVGGEVRSVRRELARFGQVDERPHARAQEEVDLLGSVRARRRPGIFACYEQGGRPI